jgi:hypothetical protein
MYFAPRRTQFAFLWQISPQWLNVFYATVVVHSCLAFAEKPHVDRTPAWVYTLEAFCILVCPFTAAVRIASALLIFAAPVPQVYITDSVLKAAYMGVKSYVSKTWHRHAHWAAFKDAAPAPPSPTYPPPPINRV